MEVFNPVHLKADSQSFRMFPNLEDFDFLKSRYLDLQVSKIQVFFTFEH